MKRHLFRRVAVSTCLLTLLAVETPPLRAICIRDSSFNPSGSFTGGASVMAAGVQADGKLIVGGYFTYNGSYPNGMPFTVNNLVRFNVDGTVDTTYAPAVNGIVRAILVLPSGSTIIAGHFTQVAGVNQTYISRLLPNGSPDYIGFQAPVPNNYIYALGLLKDGKIIVGGAFTTMGGASFQRVACLQTNGPIVSAYNPVVTGIGGTAVYAIAVYPPDNPSADKVLIGGYFSAVSGAPRANLARLTTGGVNDASFDMVPAFDGTIHAIGTDYATFTTMGPSGLNVERIYVGGSFQQPRNYFTRLLHNGGVDPNVQNSITDGTVKAIKVQANHAVIVGGHFTNAAFQIRNGLARFHTGGFNSDGSDNARINDLMGISPWADCAPVAGVSGGGVEALALSSTGKLYAGGNFTTVEGVSRPKVARLLTPAVTIDVATLAFGPESESFGVTETGRVAGDSSQLAIRTRRHQRIAGDGSGGDDLHSTLVTLLPNLVDSSALDIEQSGLGTGQMEIVGEATDSALATTRPFWYFELENGNSKSAQWLYSGHGKANAVVPNLTASYASAVVGYVRVGTQDHAAYWSVVSGQNWLYDYGNIYFPTEPSYATDTDVNRTVGFRGSPNRQAFLIDGSARTLANPPGATSTAAFAISTTGTTSKVVGEAMIGGVTKPVSWTYTGSGQSTQIVLPLPAGMTEGSARSVNAQGDVVGSAWDNNGNEAACIWIPSQPVKTLNSLSGSTEWDLRQANKITSHAGGRKIAGTGVHNGDPRGFLLMDWD